MLKSIAKRKKHRRLPNGFGQISEIKNRNLRKPFRVLITVGKDSTGHPICKPLRPQSYFETYNEAYLALNVDEYALRRMLGHRINDVTEAYYVKRDLAWLRAEILKIE